MTTRTDTDIISCDTYDEGDPLPGGFSCSYAQTRVTLDKDMSWVTLYHDKTMSFTVNGRAVYLNQDDTRELLVQMSGAWSW